MKAQAYYYWVAQLFFFAALATFNITINWAIHGTTIQGFFWDIAYPGAVPLMAIALYETVR